MTSFSTSSLVDSPSRKAARAGKNVLILMSDTGSGHRRSAEAVKAGLLQICQGTNSRHSKASDRTVTLDIRIVDLLAYSNGPLSRAPIFYAKIARHAPWLWAAGYHLSNGQLRSKLAHRWMERPLYGAFQRLEAQGFGDAESYAPQAGILPADETGSPSRETTPRMDTARPSSSEKWIPDLVVSVHGLLTAPARRAIRKAGLKAPFVSLITDLCGGHSLWYDPGSDLTLVPTAEAAELARSLRIDAAKTRIVGQAIHPVFAAAPESVLEARAYLGLAPDKGCSLILGGGDGVGHLEEIVRAIASEFPPESHQIQVIAGRNQSLEKRLHALAKQLPHSVQVTGFVDDVWRRMQASDVILSKAGPGTIMEAVALGKPSSSPGISQDRSLRTSIMSRGMA